MLKYAKVVNDQTKLCEVGIGTDIDVYISIGMTELDVEQAYDNNWYLTGYCPTPPLADLKIAKREEINRARDAAEQGGFPTLARLLTVTQFRAFEFPVQPSQWNWLLQVLLSLGLVRTIAPLI